jgi:hypothetical protein
MIQRIVLSCAVTVLLCACSAETAPAAPSSEAVREAPGKAAPPPAAPAPETTAKSSAASPSPSPSDGTEDGTEDAGAPDAAAQIAAMKALAAKLLARPEHDADVVRVQHLLIGYRKSPGIQVSRRKGESEALAADLLDRVLSGAALAALVGEYSDDHGEGIYTMTAGGSATETSFPRSAMQSAFGDVAWRLEVGEVGVCLLDASVSPYGWHIIERLE